MRGVLVAGVPAPSGAGGLEGVAVAGASSRALVIGYGNSLRADDGVGWCMADRLSADPRLGDAQVLRCQQLTPELSFDVSQASLVVFVDASSTLAAGEVALRKLTAVPGTAAWTHHLTPEALLDMSHGLYAAVPEATLVSIGAASFELGEGLSPAVERALPVVGDIVIALIREHGHGAGMEPGQGCLGDPDDA
jgi:hydrogenase maturation protease